MVTCKQGTFLTLGIVGILMGSLTIGLYSYLYDAILRTQMIVEPGSTSFEMWETLPIPMYMKLFYFNITNTEEIEARIPGVKPKLQECGPYVFKEEHKKVDIDFDHDIGTVDFRQVKTWQFVPELSHGSLDDEITTVNIIALAASEYARFNPDIFYTFAIDGFLEEVDATLFMTYPVYNWTFEGIYESILEGASTSTVIELPIPFDKFGWFYPRNNSADYDGWFGMYTGEKDFTQVGQIYSWNQSTTIRDDIYTDSCGKLNGSAGEFFPPYREKNYVDFFTPDLCRSIRFNFKEEAEVEGVSAYRYHLDETLVANATHNPDNWCFNYKQDVDMVVPNGVMNVSACKFNAPAFVSYPHFYKADPYYLNQFEPGSLNPQEELHESHLSLEPISGVPLDVKVRMQINALMRPLVRWIESEDGTYNNTLSVKLFDGLEPTYYPMVWFETYTELDDETARLMRFLGVAPNLGNIIGSIIIVLSAMTAATAGFCIWRTPRSPKNYKKRYV